MASNPEGRTPSAITDREELIYLLTEASELEHALCCCYLFAAFSLKQSTDEDLSAPELETVKRWERTISGVAVQEMLHLALASNLLTAIGAAPHLRRPNFPQPSRYYPPSFELSLRPLDERTLDHFIFIERPEDLDSADDLLQRSGSPSGGIEPIELSYATVGELYRDIETGLRALTEKLGEQRLFIGPPRAQATSALLPFSDLDPVTDLGSAIHAIELIVEQGEGLRGEIENSHYARFLAIRRDLDRLRAARPDFQPARAVMENPFTEAPPDSTGGNLMDHPEARALSDLFNAAYGLMLEMLMRFFTHTEESDEELAALVRAALAVMEAVLKPMGHALTGLPATTDGDVRRAGPSFAFYRSINYLPHREAAWALFVERLDELAAFAGTIAAADKRGLGVDRVHSTLAALSAALARHVGQSGKVTSMSGL